jgi:phosphonate ABC transporter permease subunit PhnE
MTMKNKQENKASVWKSLKVGGIALLTMIIFAYGFQVTRVSLKELSSEQRQESLTRVMRALARPDFLEYSQEQVVYNSPFFLPCPSDGTLPVLPEKDTTSTYMVVTPACANPGDTVQVEGFNFPANASGPVRFVPGSDPANTVTLGRENVETDSEGHFIATMVLPDRPSDEVQYIRVSPSRNVGLPRFSQSAKDTWDKIVETVFLALLATVAGTVIAIPMSFFAARNLMKPVKSPLLSISLSLLGWPVGIAIGLIVVRWVGSLSSQAGTNIWINLVSFVGSSALLYFVLRWALPPEEANPPKLPIRIARLAGMLLSVLAGFFGLYQLVSFMKTVGTSLQAALGSFGFLGNFLYQTGDIVGVLTSLVGGLAAGGVLGSLMGRIGQRGTEKISEKTLKILNMITTAIAGGTIFVLIGQLIEGLYQIGRPFFTLWGPLATGVTLGLLLAIIKKAKDTLPIGMAIYFITRTFLNALRSVEALIMAIVFVIAVGIGPFAGVLALGLHTIVSLAKLYSEQVESIMSGPLEAIQATGANRLQMIMYAVIPQIVPPYISYTMYRWDINVRMSTIIGFVGGGGIGFLLQQNINLLNYRGASAQMVAIAIVVASMDYISSVLREKTI